MDIHIREERQTVEVINGYGLEMSTIIKSERGVILLFFIYLYSFLAKVFAINEIALDSFFVVHGDKEMFRRLESCMQVYSYGITRVDLYETQMEFIKKITAVSDEPLFLYFGSGNWRESVIQENIGAIKRKLYRESGNGQDCLPLPIIEFESFLPDLGFRRSDYILIDLRKAGMNSVLSLNRYQKMRNEDFVRDITQWVGDNYAEIKKFIDRKRWESRSEEDDLRRRIRIISATMAYTMAKSETNEIFPILCEGFVSAFQSVLQDQDANYADIVEAFRFCLQKCLGKKNYRMLNRKEVERLDDLKDTTVILYDDTFYYFARKYLEDCCSGELLRIPFLRILQNLATSGLLKRTEKKDRDLTCVINILSPNQNEQRLIRRIGINREFFEGMLFRRM